MFSGFASAIKWFYDQHTKVDYMDFSLENIMLEFIHEDKLPRVVLIGLDEVPTPCESGNIYGTMTCLWVLMVTTLGGISIHEVPPEVSKVLSKEDSSLLDKFCEVMSLKRPQAPVDDLSLDWLTRMDELIKGFEPLYDKEIVKKIAHDVQSIWEDTVKI
ncbi:hypothetical protein BU23DRAFT_125604 [Bimuria novae-zelandiae CBS 107.79]|uniref:Uncharacterized protein n=1 Tax=Bimuria novae-zelandiae CBS 107.79 TaxID=1447943 RepID=A0A6A5VBY5_9PLEO|nr:hypothetical protein BU23DRAFT_125604 [Bimuria novae-zelandiae CBS 107.79]